MRKTLLIALAAVLGCDNTVEPKRQQDLWKELGISNYSYVYSESCFCGFTGPNPARITVKNGVVVSVTATDAALTPFTGDISGYPTIDGLFTILKSAAAKNPATFDVSYDETYHFPRMIYIDPVQRTADDEVTYRAEQFTPGSQ
jgi:hypothetical protein